MSIILGECAHAFKLPPISHSTPTSMKHALLRELQHFLDICDKERTHITAPWKISSIYFGGGTPTLAQVHFKSHSFQENFLVLSVPQESTLASIIEFIAARGLLKDNAEITLEANPTVCQHSTTNLNTGHRVTDSQNDSIAYVMINNTLQNSEIQLFKSFRGIGVNRLSLGVQVLMLHETLFVIHVWSMQSLIDEDLKFLGRNHSAHVCFVFVILQISAIITSYSRKPVKPFHVP
jgi:coproporphyrinogen III oxidase-like Fe-S oxidoreductase